MLWLGLVFVWFAWTVLVRNARAQFACGALVAAFVTVGLLHLVNPDDYIVRANAAHARAGRSFDAGYAASLSADAVPAIISVLPTLNRDERCLAERALLRGWTSAAVYDEDWRAWNFARWRARRAVAAHRESLSEASCTPPASGVPADTSTSGVPADSSTSAPVGPPPPPPPAPLTNATPAGTTARNADLSTAGGANAATMPLITETKSATVGLSKVARAAPPRDGGKTEQRGRTRAAGRRKTH
jgi:hypothetical protein